MNIPSKCFCCHLECGPGTTATWGFWVEPLPDNISHACNKHLGEMLPAGSTHHTNGERFNIWSLDEGYDGTLHSKEEIDAAKFRDQEGHEASPPYCAASCPVCH